MISGTDNNKKDLSNGKSDLKEEPEVDPNTWNSQVLEESNKSILWSIIKQIKVGTEVKHLQLPIFVVQPRSLLEKLADNFSHAQLVLRAPKIVDPEERFLLVLKFYLSSFHIRPRGVKNPLNPLIGETFACKWEHPDSTSYYVAEQLSHHPPRTAFCFYDIKNGVAVNSNLAPSYVKFYGNSAETRISGSSKISLFSNNLEETYSFSFPTFLVRGILVGTLAMEMIGKVQCSCAKTGYTAEIEFKSKGLLFGKYNELVGKVKKKGQKGAIYTIHGFWDGTISITNVRSKQTSVFF